jgi:hypothetical protein
MDVELIIPRSSWALCTATNPANGGEVNVKKVKGTTLNITLRNFMKFIKNSLL